MGYTEETIEEIYSTLRKESDHLKEIKSDNDLVRFCLNFCISNVDMIDDAFSE